MTWDTTLEPLALGHRLMQGSGLRGLSGRFQCTGAGLTSHPGPHAQGL